jgi:hypothetical protein
VPAAIHVPNAVAVNTQCVRRRPADAPSHARFDFVGCAFNDVTMLYLHAYTGGHHSHTPFNGHQPNRE